MKQKRTYRQLTEAEKRYIDRLVNEAFTDSVKNFGNSMKDFVTDLGNSAKKGYDNFHRVLNGQKPDRNPVNMSPWEVQWKSAYDDDERIPTDRSQWSQLNDFIADIVTKGQHSKKKNELLNKQMQRDMQTKDSEANSYWMAKLLNYWGYTFKQNVNGTNAAYRFILWLNQVSGVESDLIEAFNEAHNNNVRMGLTNGDIASEFFQFIDQKMGGWINYKYRDICDYIIYNYNSSKGQLNYNGFLNWLNNKQQNNSQN